MLLLGCSHFCLDRAQPVSLLCMRLRLRRQGRWIFRSLTGHWGLMVLGRWSWRVLLLPLRHWGLQLGIIQCLRCHISNCRAPWPTLRARIRLKRVLAHVRLRLRPRRLRVACGPLATRLMRTTPLIIVPALPLPLTQILLAECSQALACGHPTACLPRSALVIVLCVPQLPLRLNLRVYRGRSVLHATCTSTGGAGRRSQKWPLKNNNICLTYWLRCATARQQATLAAETPRTANRALVTQTFGPSGRYGRG